MFNSGHMSEHLVWAPDPRDDVAFNLYAMDCEHEKAMREATEAIKASNEYFPSVNYMNEYLRLNVPGAYSQLSNTDIVDLWYHTSLG